MNVFGIFQEWFDFFIHGIYIFWVLPWSYRYCKTDKKYTSKAAVAYRAELAKLVEIEAAKVSAIPIRIDRVDRGKI